jgi:AcrR family transcriptional regulator
VFRRRLVGRGCGVRRDPTLPYRLQSRPCSFESTFEFVAMRHSLDGRDSSAAVVAAALPGVRSAKQARSLRKHHALLQAGHRLLAAQDLASLSVARLTREAGMAVGSFYSRFADKDAWFAELLRSTGEAVLLDTQRLLGSAHWQRAGDARKVALIVQHIVGVHRQHRGIFRAALSDASRAKHGQPVHAYGWQLAEAVHGSLAARMHEVPPAQRRLRVGIALQIVYGTLVNAVQRDPGPIMLDDARMERELTRVFLDTVRLR